MENQIEYLESERKKLWDEIDNLKALLNTKTEDYFIEAKRNSNEIHIFKLDLLASKEKIDLTTAKVNEKLLLIDNIYNNILNRDENIKNISISINQEHQELKLKTEIINKWYTEFENIYQQKSDIELKLLKLEDFYNKSNEIDTKTELLHSDILKRKKEVDKIYYEIFGYKQNDENSKEITIEGTVDKLKKAYDDLQNEISNLSLEINTSITNNNNIFINAKDNWTKEFEEIKHKIEELLPEALTKGLSSAYTKQKEEQIEDSKKLNITFVASIIGLVIVSLIPFGISVKSLIDNEKLIDVIERIPRLVLAIIPLYVPVLWIAYSSDKKLKLSKRLKEEYAHKEVMSRTFEGLSNQLKNISEKDIANELKIKLLYNILEVNSENPGKLISDYDKSDHPFMDALDKSVKLSNVLTKIEKIPGIRKLLTASLENKSEQINKEQTEKVEHGLTVAEELKK